VARDGFFINSKSRTHNQNSERTDSIGRMLQSVKRPSDELIIQHLGAAVMLCWHALPLTVQQQILVQSTDVVGVAPITGIRDEIVRLMLRRAPRMM
jgi:hypothetical protein